MRQGVYRLGAFLDTLVLNVYPTTTNYAVEKKKMAPELKTELDLLKQRAQDEEEDIPTRFVFNSVPLNMKTKGSEGFNWILSNAHISFAVNRSSKMQLWAQVRCSSEYLWIRRDIATVLNEVHLFLVSIFGEFIVLHVSSVDLAVDVVGLNFGSIQEVKQNFVSRAQLGDLIPASVDEVLLDGPDKIKTRWGRLTGLPFGARNAAVSALIYDKTHEIKYKSPEKKWFHDLWRDAAQKQGFTWTEDMQVWRIEMRLKRPALHEMKKSILLPDGENKQKEHVFFHGIESAFDLEDRIPGLWAYLVGHIGGGLDGLPDGWLRYVVPSEDSNRSRWSVHPDWEAIQEAFIPEPIEKSAVEKRQEEEEELWEELEEYLKVYPMSTSKTPKQRRQQPVIVPLLPPAEVLDLIPLVRKRKREINMDRMVAQIAGCITTFEAWRAHGKTFDKSRVNLSTTFHTLQDAVESYMLQRMKDYSEQVEKKRGVYHIEESLA